MIPIVIRSKKYKYYPSKYLSSGSYGHVFIYETNVLLAGKPLKIAVKVIEDTPEDCEDTSNYTVCTSNILNQRCITPKRLYYDWGYPTILVMDPMDGDLYDFLVERDVKKAEKLKICRDITKGLTCFNKKKGFYTDLKIDNCLYRRGDKDGQFEYVVGDVTLCEKGPGKKIVASYPAPQYFLENIKSRCTEKETVWQLGLFILKVFLDDRASKWSRHRIKSTIVGKSRKKKEEYLESQISELTSKFDTSSELKNLKGLSTLKRCLIFDPEKRPTLKSVLRVLNNNMKKPKKSKSKSK